MMEKYNSACSKSDGWWCTLMGDFQEYGMKWMFNNFMNKLNEIKRSVYKTIWRNRDGNIMGMIV